MRDCDCARNFEASKSSSQTLIATGRVARLTLGEHAARWQPSPGLPVLHGTRGQARYYFQPVFCRRRYVENGIQIRLRGSKRMCHSFGERVDNDSSIE